MTDIVRPALGCALALLVFSATAQTTIAQAWVRGTVAQQKASGAFMRITSVKGGRLVSAHSPVAGAVEVHAMTMDGDTMKMHPIESLDLPAAKPVELKPGGYHLMLLDLKRALNAGETVPITLEIVGSDGQRERVEIKVPVKALGAPAGHGH